MPDEHEPDHRGGRSAFERFLGIFAEVRGGEGINAVLMFLNVFLILAAYYILKPVREGLAIGGITLGGIEGDEAKAYLSAIMAFLLLGIIPLYGYLGSRMSRLKLIWASMSFIVLCLVGFLFWGQATGSGTAIGITFFIWLGIFNYFLTAQFWSFANDIYTEAQGKRLFAIIAIGQSLGAVAGPFIADLGSDYTFLLLGLAAAILVVSIGLYTVVNAREKRNPDLEKRALAERPLSKEGGFELVFKTRYLFLIAMTLLVTNLVNSTGEFLLSNAVKNHAKAQVPAASVLDRPSSASSGGAGKSTPSAPIDEKTLTKAQQQRLKDARTPIINKFYARFYGIVNLVGVLIQMLLVSRIFKYLGLRVALFILPVLAFGGYAAIGIIGGLLIVRVVKTAENATDYSLQNTVRQALFLPTSREAKYKAKQVIDVFFVRFGDAGSALLVGLGLHALSLSVGQLAGVNVGLCAIWILITVAIAREHRKLVPDDGPKIGQAAGRPGPGAASPQPG